MRWHKGHLAPDAWPASPVLMCLACLLVTFILGNAVLSTYLPFKLCDSNFDQILKQRELLDFLTRIDTSAIASPTPPAFLVVGSKHSGKSSFINSVYKLVYNEPGALIRRAETGYHGTVSSLHIQPPTTLHYKFFPVLRSPLSSLRAPMLTLIDTPALQDSLREDELFNLLLNEVAESYDMATLFPECVILLVNSAQFDKEKAKFDWGGGVRVPNISRFLREEGKETVHIAELFCVCFQVNTAKRA